MTLSGAITRSNFEAYHIVTLSCILDYSKKLDIETWLAIEDNELNDYVFEDNHMRLYWSPREIETFSTPEEKPYNLWRIDEKYCVNYAIALNTFFKHAYFTDKDLTGLNNCIAELFQNILDHAQANGTAFVSIEYKETEEVIDIAICDFGVGIPYTLKSQFEKDTEALRNCLKTGVTAQTTKNNKGWGMHNIVSTMSGNDIMHIVSNKAMLVKYNEKEEVEVYPLPFEFTGTLIYLTVSVHGFEQEEFIETFTF